MKVAGMKPNCSMKVGEADGGDDAKAEARGVRAGLVERNCEKVGGRWRGRADEEGEISEPAAAAFVDMARGKGGFPSAIPGVEDRGGADGELFVAGLAGVVIGLAGDGETESLAVDIGFLRDVARDAGDAHVLVEAQAAAEVKCGDGVALLVSGLAAHPDSGRAIGGLVRRDVVAF